MNALNTPAVPGMAMAAMQSCQPSCLGLVFQENRGAGAGIRAFHSGDVNNQVNDDIGIRPRLTGLLQEFGSRTWPRLLCFSSSSSIKWNSRTSLQMTTWSELSWPHVLAPCPGPMTWPHVLAPHRAHSRAHSALLLLPQLQPDPSVTQNWLQQGSCIHLLHNKIRDVPLKRY